jgi:hypothetical protein
VSSAALLSRWNVFPAGRWRCGLKKRHVIRLKPRLSRCSTCTMDEIDMAPAELAMRYLLQSDIEGFTDPALTWALSR